MGRPATPRWGGEGWPLSIELARRLYLLRTRAAEALRDGFDHLAEMLRQDYHLGPRTASELANHFLEQESVSEIPDASTCLVEAAGMTGCEYYLHTPLHRAGNDALARVMVRRLARSRNLVV